MTTLLEAAAMDRSSSVLDDEAAALPSPAPVSEPTGEEVEAMARHLCKAYEDARYSDDLRDSEEDAWWPEVARAALALGARPPTKETT
jgi:hypothetical protein